MYLCIFNYFSAKNAKQDAVVLHPNSVKGMPVARIVFVLTVNGKAVRQVMRLIKTLYHRQHYFYIHVDIVSKVDIYHHKINIFMGILKSACLSVCVCVCLCTK